MNSNVFISSCSTKFYKIVFLKKFTEFTWKHLRSTTLIKRDSSADVFLCKIFKSPLLQNTSVWLHPDFFICLRWFYSRQDVSGILWRHGFFLLLHMHKSFVYWHFPNMLIPLKIRSHFNFSALNKDHCIFKQIIFEYSCK